MFVSNFVYRTGINYYPQVFLEEYKYVIKENKIPKYIIDNVEISFDTDKESSDEENSDAENLKILLMKFCVYIKMLNNYYQKQIERLQKEAHGIYQNLYEEEKDRRQKRLETDIKIFPKNKSKNYLSI